MYPIFPVLVSLRCIGASSSQLYYYFITVSKSSTANSVVPPQSSCLSNQYHLKLPTCTGTIEDTEKILFLFLALGNSI